jgi:uncharacterized membrane protein
MLRTSFLAVIGLIALKLVFGAFSLLWALITVVVPVLLLGALLYWAYKLFAAESAHQA